MDKIYFEDEYFRIEKVSNGRVIRIKQTSIKNDEFETDKFSIKINTEGVMSLIDEFDKEMNFYDFMEIKGIKNDGIFRETLNRIMTELFCRVTKKQSKEEDIDDKM